MIVRCVKSFLPSDDPECVYWCPDLTRNNSYQVIAIEDDHYRLIGDEGRPCIYSADAFDVIDPTIDSTWISVRDEKTTEFYCGPAELNVAGLFEDYFEGKEAARRIIERYLA